MTFKYKQVLIVRKDLEMSCGKIAVQVAHASIMAAEECRKRRPEWFNQWRQEGQKKVVIKVKN
ncbi:MAG TPA: peptidyl-tRNA hydrolase, partial [Thermoproteales archaeon]|nr:peptidyl-tRNA hydrolase [Thermoproteales archaeon]